jgi:hypothetical protein
MDTSPDDSPPLTRGDTVQVSLDAHVVECYPDGTYLVDADGCEIMVHEDELR